MNWMDEAPLWAIGLVLWAGCSLVHEACYRAGRRFGTSDGAADGKGYLVASSLALMGLMTAFTFGSAQSNFRQRQDLVIAEANAVATTYQRSRALPEPWRARLGRQLLQYAEARAAFGASRGDPQKIALATARTESDEKTVWETVSDVLQSSPQRSLSEPLEQSVNDLFNLARSRRAALDIRTPVSVLRMLALAGMVASGIVGFARAADRRYVVITSLVLLIQTMAFCLIIDLDRPFSSTIKVNQAAMDRAIADIRASEAAKPAADTTGPR